MNVKPLKCNAYEEGNIRKTINQQKKQDSIGVLSCKERKPLTWFINKSILQKYEN